MTRSADQYAPTAASARIVRDALRAEQALPAVPATVILEQIVGHLGAAVAQLQPSDDAIIADHLRAANEFALALFRSVRK